MKSKLIYKISGAVLILVSLWGCRIPQAAMKVENRALPSSFKTTGQDSASIANMNWRTFFADQKLIALIDTALSHNQELNIILQEIEISQNEVRARKGEYLPFVNVGGEAGVDKAGRYTRFGALEEELEVKPGTHFPEPLQDYYIGAVASWEVDIWKKLRNARKAAVIRYLASVEGKNFMVNHLIAEISDAYYELMALDNLLDIIERSIEIQSNALKTVKIQKEAARVTQLAVNRFEAQLLGTQNLQFAIKQRIVETENRINFLTGKYQPTIERNSEQFLDLNIGPVQTGVPSQLLRNRPDIRQAEFELEASKIDIEVARANFFPSLEIRAGVGFQAFNPVFLVNPQSILFNLAGGMMAPLINKNAIQAEFNTASAKQIQAVYNYEQSILNAYVEVLNELAKIDNFSQSYETKNKEVNILMQSITIANSLFNSVRADYAEVLLTQREALQAKMELIEIKMEILSAKVNIYRALGGGGN